MNNYEQRIAELEEQNNKMEEFLRAIDLPFDLDEIDIDSIWVNYTENIDLRRGKSFTVKFEYEYITEDEEEEEEEEK